MIEIVPFDPSHIRMINLNYGYDLSVLDGYHDVSDSLTESVGIRIDGELKILAILSGTFLWLGNFEMSALISAEAAKYPLAFFRHVQKRVDFYQETLQIRRIQATIRVGFPFLVKWIELLGFEREALLKKYGREGDDYYMYARFRT